MHTRKSELILLGKKQGKNKENAVKYFTLGNLFSKNKKLINHVVGGQTSHLSPPTLQQGSPELHSLMPQHCLPRDLVSQPAAEHCCVRPHVLSDLVHALPILATEQLPVAVHCQLHASFVVLQLTLVFAESGTQPPFEHFMQNAQPPRVSSAVHEPSSAHFLHAPHCEFKAVFGAHEPPWVRLQLMHVSFVCCWHA
jgi:hypothetical protein